jgi:hypothetical protein
MLRVSLDPSSYNVEEWAAVEYTRIKLEENRQCVYSNEFVPCDTPLEKFMDEVSVSYFVWNAEESNQCMVCRLKVKNALCFAMRYSKLQWKLQVACETADELIEIHEYLTGLFPIIKIDTKISDTRRVDFCGWAGKEAFVKSRYLEMVNWSNVEPNYSHDTKEAMNKLVNLKPPFGEGQLMLFHGVPGTGKTFAIRTLIHKWSSWCKPVYILDPEVFFSNSVYMTQIALEIADSGNGVEPVHSRYDDDSEDNVDLGIPDREKWKLLILADSGEMLSKDAKMNTGQGFGRLLNLANGLIGQGIKVLSLITTNEPIESLHEAVAREGRCLANVNFSTLSIDDSNAWLRAKESEVKVNKSCTIAKLYSILNENKQIITGMERSRAGF